MNDLNTRCTNLWLPIANNFMVPQGYAFSKPTYSASHLLKPLRPYVCCQLSTWSEVVNGMSTWGGSPQTITSFWITMSNKFMVLQGLTHFQKRRHIDHILLLVHQFSLFHKNIAYRPPIHCNTVPKPCTIIWLHNDLIMILMPCMDHYMMTAW